LGRRIGVFIYRNGSWLRLYRLYEGDTLLAEVEGDSGRVVAEYVWGPLGPIARLDYADPSRTRYYVLDGQGHMRVLLAPDGQPAEVWTYDSWGNRIEREVNDAYGAVAQPFTWNAAYGYEWDCFAGTGLYHVGAREYDPRTARWLQRDPIDAASGDPNLYRYAGNDPINQIDPDGSDWTYHDLLDAVGFIPGIGDLADVANAIGYALEGDLAKAGRVGKKVVQELVEEGAEQAAKREAKNALQEQGKKVANKTSGDNPYAQRGREIHKQFEEEAKAKGWETERKKTKRVDPKTNRNVYPDAIDECGRPVELKPDTPSGRRRAKTQGEKYKRATGKDPVIIYYDPKTGRILYP
jgi:RHS repeat-associated protein